MTSAQSARSEWFVNGQFLNHMAKFVDWSPEHGYQSNYMSFTKRTLIIQRLCLTLPLFEDNENTADSEALRTTRIQQKLSIKKNH